MTFLLYSLHTPVLFIHHQCSPLVIASVYKSVLHSDRNLQKAQRPADRNHVISQLNIALGGWFPWCDAAEVYWFLRKEGCSFRSNWSALLREADTSVIINNAIRAFFFLCFQFSKCWLYSCYLSYVKWEENINSDHSEDSGNWEILQKCKLFCLAKSR